MPDSPRFPPLLVVDDDPPVALLMADWCAMKGFSVQVCNSAMQALEILDGWTNGIVLVDLNMPVMDGLAFCRALKAPTRPWTPYFILTTGEAPDEGFLEAAFKQGIDDFVHKPVMREELIGRLLAASRLVALEDDIRMRSEMEIEHRIYQAGMAELKEVVATLAHDLRTPIAAMRTTAEMLAWRGPELPPDVESGLKRLVSLSIHLSETVTDVADAFLCEDADQLRNSWSEFDLAQEGAHACELVRATARPGVSLECISKDGLDTFGNPPGIRRLLVNLLSNALRATSEGFVRIEVQKAEEPGFVLLTVRDSGKGIPPEILPHLGEPMMLSSGASERGRSVHGAGLGIAICRRIVAYHGGRMFVETCQGNGTTFRIWLRQDLSGPMLGAGHCPLDREIRE